MAGMPWACYRHPVANLQVKNVPAELHEKLQSYAADEGRTLRDVVLEALRREVARREFRSRLAGRAPVDLGRPAAGALEEARQGRDDELGT
jgi:plasmid stability protein